MCVQIQSDKLGELFKALCLVQAEVQYAEASYNPHYRSKYAKLEDVVKACRPTLTKHGITISQFPLTHDDGTDRLVTWLAHGGSEQFLKSCVTINHDKRNIQDLARYTTYLKRIVYSSMVGVVIGEEDDDAEGTESVKTIRKEEAARKEEVESPDRNVDNLISDKQAGFLASIIKAKPVAEQREFWGQLTKEFDISAITEIQKKDFQEILDRAKA